jgi:hypothetical protein
MRPYASRDQFIGRRAQALHQLFAPIAAAIYQLLRMLNPHADLKRLRFEFDPAFAEHSPRVPSGMARRQDHSVTLDLTLTRHDATNLPLHRVIDGKILHANPPKKFHARVL